MSFVRSLYSLATVLAQPLLLRRLRRRAAAEPLYGQHIHERFGHYQPPTLGQAEAGRWVWVHAVSLGETHVAAQLIRVLRRAIPGMRLLLTHGTATGRTAGQTILREGDIQVWQPWDSPQAVRRFVAQFRPLIGIFMETEVWPNLIAECQRTGVPLVLANARLNEKSQRRARRLGWLSAPAYGSFAAVLAQTEQDAQRLRSVGTRVVAVTGNIKFDQQPSTERMAQGLAWRLASPRPIALFASSREGEEALWLQQWLEHNAAASSNASSTTPLTPDTSLGRFSAASAHAASDAAAAPLSMRDVQWLIVPRHPQRFDEVATMLSAAGLRVARRSKWADRMPPVDADVWLGDSMGEMALYCSSAHIALLGGSFAPLGGQNLIEATACGCPVVLGPHTFNFEQPARSACQMGAAQRVRDMAHGVRSVLELLTQRPRLHTASQHALEFAQSQRGATVASTVAIVRVLQTAYPSKVQTDSDLPQ